MIIDIDICLFLPPYIPLKASKQRTQKNFIISFLFTLLLLLRFRIISIQFPKKYTSLTQPGVPQHLTRRLSFTGVKNEHFEHEITRLPRLLFRDAMLLKALNQAARGHFLPPNMQEAPISCKIL